MIRQGTQPFDAAPITIVDFPRQPIERLIYSFAEVPVDGSIPALSDVWRTRGRPDTAHAWGHRHGDRHRELVRAHGRLVLSPYRRGGGGAVHVRQACRAGDHGLRYGHGPRRSR